MTEPAAKNLERPPKKAASALPEPPSSPREPKQAGDARNLQKMLEQRLHENGARSFIRSFAPKLTPRARRLCKSLAGAALVVVFGIQPLRLLLETGSAEAVVNAPLLTLRAPIDGVVGFDGAAITLDDARADSNRLDDATQALARTVDERLSLERRREKAERELARLDRQVEAFRKGRILQLEARIAEFDHRISVADTQVEEAVARADRAAALTGKAVSVVEADQTRRSALIARELASAARAQRDQGRIELDAARNGTFLGDSYNDVPSSAQRADELRRRIADFDADLAALDEKTERLRHDLEAERLRHDRMARAIVAAPAKSRVWEILVSPGENVRRGQELARYVDCSSPVVTAAVGEAAYNSLVIGESARFRAADGSEVFGQVVNLTGPSGAAANLAITPAALTKAPFRVSVAVPPSKGHDCGIGRTGRLVFDGAPKPQ
jgi:multidrug resistance efflux pump